MTSLHGIGNIVYCSSEEFCHILSLEWQIPNFMPLSDCNYESSDFLFCGERWFLDVWPNQYDTVIPEPEGLDIFLERRDEGPPVAVQFALGIKGTEGVEKRQMNKQVFRDDNNFYGCVDLCSRQELKNRMSELMPNNTLTITVEMKKVAPYTAKDVEKLQNSLRSALMTGEDSDLIIKVQGKEFPAHRVILRSRSSVFRAMLAHDMVEKQSGVVTIDDCDPQVFSDFLDHVYTGSSEKITLGNVFDLYIISNKYEMDTLKEQCVDFIKKNLSIASFCSVMKLAIKHDDTGLIEFTATFFSNNSSAIVKTTAWQAFYEENSDVGYKLLIKALTK